MTKELIRLKVNGELHELAVPPQKLLLDVLREDLGLTGSKRGCDDSSCGCCAVLVDGVPMLSCVAIASLIATKALLDRNPNPSLEEIRVALSSNLCRCTGYMQIYESVKLAIERTASRAARPAPVGD